VDKYKAEYVLWQSKHPENTKKISSHTK
jgi:hypothetical protein